MGLQQGTEGKRKDNTKVAYHDKLTGAANRSLFYEVSASLLLQAKRNKTLLGLIFCDVNKFKSINDTYGHEFGDKVLIHISQLLEKSAREMWYGMPVWGRWICNSSAWHERCWQLQSLFLPESWNYQKTSKDPEHTISLSISGGISFYPIDAETIDQLLVKADAAMYAAKQQKGTETYFYRMNKKENRSFLSCGIYYTYIKIERYHMDQYTTRPSDEVQVGYVRVMHTVPNAPMLTYTWMMRW